MDGYKSLTRYFPETQIGVLHGRMKSENKEYEMKRFADGKSKILVSTTVIEVGVDVANASVIIIESAERFGLSQLHQLRGRVGRGKHPSHCLLAVYFPISEEGKARMKALQNSRDGFEIAEEDLKLRGFGDLTGYQQSGIKNFRFADPIIHEELFKLAENYVKNIYMDVNQKYSFLLKLFDKAEIINTSEI